MDTTTRHRIAQSLRNTPDDVLAKLVKNNAEALTCALSDALRAECEAALELLGAEQERRAERARQQPLLALEDALTREAQR